jgi:two-component system OmpR family response regulator/two-component system response regulator RstA
MNPATPSPRILLVEDDARLASMVADFLSPHGFDVAIEGRGDAAIDRIVHDHPDAVLLDVNLPGLDGFSICKAVRTSYRGVIIMLTARGEEVDEVLGLQAGADDYLAKPVRPRALLARLQTHLRRATPAEGVGPPIVVGALVIDAGRRSVTLDGQPVELTTAEFDLLYLLAQHAGQPLSRQDLYVQIHGMKYDGLDRSIDLRISRLRKKLGDDPTAPKRIKSVRGLGYLLTVES